MERIEPEEVAEFERVLRNQRMTRADSSTSEIDVTDSIIGDGMSWLELFRNDIKSGAFVGQDTLDVCTRTRKAPTRRQVRG